MARPAGRPWFTRDNSDPSQFDHAKSVSTFLELRYGDFPSGTTVSKLARDLAGCRLAASEVATYVGPLPTVSTLKDLMAEGDSPTVARRRVRIALREAREAAGYTQLEAARAARVRRRRAWY